MWLNYLFGARALNKPGYYRVRVSQNCPSAVSSAQYLGAHPTGVWTGGIQFDDGALTRERSREGVTQARALAGDGHGLLGHLKRRRHVVVVVASGRSIHDLVAVLREGRLALGRLA